MAVLAGTLATGGAGDVFGALDVAVTRRQATADGIADTMRATLATSAGASVTFVVYADSGAAPGVLLAQSAANAVVNGTNTGTLLATLAVVNGTFYWIGFYVTGATVNLTDNTPGGYRGRAGEASIPDPFGTLEFSDATNSLPVTLEGTIGSGLVLPPVIAMDPGGGPPAPPGFFATPGPVLLPSTATDWLTQIDDTLSLADATTLDVSSAIADTLSLADAITNDVQKALTEALPLADSLTKDIQTALIETLTLADLFSNEAGKILVETIALADNTITESGKEQLLNDTLSLADAITSKDVGKAIADTLALADSVIRDFQKVLADTLALADAISNEAGKLIADTLALADNVLTESGKEQLLNDTLALADAITSKDVGKLNADTLALADAIALSSSISITDTVALVESISKLAGLTVADVIGLADSVDPQIAGNALTQNVNDTLALADALTKQIQLVRVDVLALDDVVVKFSSITLADAIALDDQVTKGGDKPWVIVENVIATFIGIRVDDEPGYANPVDAASIVRMPPGTKE